MSAIGRYNVVEKINGKRYPHSERSHSEAVDDFNSTLKSSLEILCDNTYIIDEVIVKEDIAILKAHRIHPISELGDNEVFTVITLEYCGR